jgi:hypothetical protein
VARRGLCGGDVHRWRLSTTARWFWAARGRFSACRSTRTLR